METEDITKLVDDIYKNILDKFNPGARQLITAGKAYLKALHGAAAASRLYVDAISKLAKQAQQGTWGASADIGSALMQIVDVYKEIQAQQINTLKAFYVDMLVPLETNLEKDTKVVQSEQKRFLQQHKQQAESYSKVEAALKKHRKKSRAKTSAGALDREVRNLQALEEQRAKMDAFCEASLKTALTQERRRYGFVLERQCSLAKHWLVAHAQGKQALEGRLDEWQEVAQAREALPPAVEAALAAGHCRPPAAGAAGGDDDDVDDGRASVASRLRKARSVDASCLDLRSAAEEPAPASRPRLSRAKSDFNLTASTHSLLQDVQDSEPRRKSMAVTTGWEGSQLARALYPYLSSGDNQLSFLEGDVIEILGERNKGWQFGENLRTHSTGWFPLAYTEVIFDGIDDSSPTDSACLDAISNGAATPVHHRGGSSSPPGKAGHSPNPSLSNTHSRAPAPQSARVGSPPMNHRPVRRQPGHNQSVPTHINIGPPPSLPAPVPRRKLPPPPLPPLRTTGASTSLHSSNDSGFSNDPPPAPEVDYSDDETSKKHSSKKAASLTLSKEKLRGWLLYKSALDLWQDVNNNTGQHEMQNNHQIVSKQASSLAHLATLGRFSSNEKQLQPPTIVQRTRSLWKFRRPQNSVNGDVLEGMALWQHRSLVDVPSAVESEEKKTTEEKKTNEKTAVAVQTEDLSDSDSDESNSNYYLLIEDHHRRASVNGLLSYGQTLKKRLSKPDRGSRFDQRSQTTGNMCGPWYDLWGLDESVVK
ncbi:brain-specific angiogenesis inhibitor 1-associated protein 2-like isoform X1 [Schistocerca gregaria]|uniref:brain-specific angiogenesis inhibitor 1-associated protein 2-like isoform X1 n=1 Tax=Schistocerca gregaria TaxID=7010 RepID=UPI00211E54A9|nr:brain-specific angiogenesis inhibitor 1-associated protein 2-like isoform X1 [Schistocerca gregaria]